MPKNFYINLTFFFCNKYNVNNTKQQTSESALPLAEIAITNGLKSQKNIIA